MKNVTAVLISFLRPEYTKECIRSLYEVTPGIKIIVAENGPENLDLKDYVESYGGEYVLMPFDSGVCYARNRLIERVQTEYVLVGDDDFYYLPDPGLQKMEVFLNEHKDIALIGGRINEQRRVLDYQGDIDICEDHLEYKALDISTCELDQASGLKYKVCDITFNFFIARLADIKDHKWDENIKVAFEHSDWFITLKKAGVKVAFTPDVVVVHKPNHVVVEESKKYMSYRMRRSDMKYFFEKHHLVYSIGFRGARTNSAPLKNAGKQFYAKIGLSHEGKTYNAGDIVETEYPTDNMEPCW